MHVTDCECTEPGWCERHKCDKSRYAFEHCRRRLDFFEAWEQGGMRHLCRGEDTSLRSVSCVHRGQETRRVDCETCRGHVQVKVFECDIHDECVIGRSVDDVVSCAVCKDWQAVGE